MTRPLIKHLRSRIKEQKIVLYYPSIHPFTLREKESILRSIPPRHKTSTTREKGSVPWNSDVDAIPKIVFGQILLLLMLVMENAVKKEVQRSSGNRRTRNLLLMAAPLPLLVVKEDGDVVGPTGSADSKTNPMLITAMTTCYF